MKLLLVLTISVRLCEYLAVADLAGNEQRVIINQDSALNEKEGEQMNELLNKAIASTNTVYLSAEKALLLAPQAVESVLSANLTNNDPVARAIARSVLDMRRRPDSPNNTALKILSSTEERSLKTVRGTPHPDVTASQLYASLGPAAAEYLALRLVKDAEWQDKLQDWKAKSVLRYLHAARNPDAADLVIQFATETKRGDLRREAVEAFQGIDRPQLQRKLEAQRERLRNLGKVMPPELSTLLRN